MDKEFEEMMKQEFLLEAMERLEECESAFLSLEQRPDDRATLDHIFRLAHTIKGSGYAVGFDDLAGFAHVFEALLDKLRTGEVQSSPVVMDLLFKSNDLLAAYVKALRNDPSAKVDTSVLAGRINSVLSEPVPGREVPVATELPRSVAPNKGAEPLVKPAAILAVDDDPDQLEIIRASLSRLDVKFTGLTSSIEALQFLKTQSVDLIVSDLKMPELDGIEFARRVAAEGSTTPIVFCSGFAQRKDLSEFIKLGAVGFLDKPFDLDQLNLLVVNALHAKMTKEAVLRLAKLSFQGYRLVSGLAIDAGMINDEKHASRIKELECLLDQISRLSHFIMTPSTAGLDVEAPKMRVKNSA